MLGTPVTGSAVQSHQRNKHAKSSASRSWPPAASPYRSCCT